MFFRRMSFPQTANADPSRGSALLVSDGWTEHTKNPLCSRFQFAGRAIGCSNQSAVHREALVAPGLPVAATRIHFPLTVAAVRIIP